MTVAIQETTSQLIERTRSRLEAHKRDTRTDSQRASVAFWFGAPGLLAGSGLLGASQAHVYNYTFHVSWAGPIIALVAGIAATAAAVCLFQLYLRLVKAAHDVENRLERLQWLETQARDGLLTDEETRAEVLLLTR